MTIAYPAQLDHLTQIHQQTHQQTHRAAVTAVSQATTWRNWLIGAWIFEYEQAGSDRAYGERRLYGREVMTRISGRLSQEGKELGLDELLVLNALMSDRRLEAGEAAALMQQSPVTAKALLERMVEQGMVEATGERPRVYHLSASIYRRLSTPEGYVRTHGIDRLRWEGLIMEWAVNHGRVARGEVITLLQVTPDQAYKTLERMCQKMKLRRMGKGRKGSYYVPADTPGAMP